MKESGLLHCLPVPIFQFQAQVCFIHLTVKEFLAAKHIVELKGPQEILPCKTCQMASSTSVSCWVIGKENENV